MSGPLSYAVVTPARDEAENVHRLAQSLAQQSARPTVWIVVDDGSRDETASVVREQASMHPWIVLVTAESSARVERGGKVVRAFQAGLHALEQQPDIVVKVDADVSFPGDYFDRLSQEFAAHPRLGMASGAAHEIRNGVWKERHMTSGSLWGAARAYRWECLQDVLPLEERMGWDGIDALKAGLAGWETRIVPGLHFRHHRIEGERDGRRTRAWSAQGRASHYMGYRFSYLLVRSLHYSLRDPAALAMIAGYLRSAMKREEQYDDEQARRALRERQRLRSLPTRAIEALGRGGQR
jgi:glycosyltransferase involved in cell wall biosynthesis